MSEPNEPAKPSRLIVPGAGTEPAKPSRLIVPGAGTEPAEAAVSDARPRIILPPGVSADTHEDLPEYPRLRPVQLTPVRDGDRELLVVTDPLGVTPGQAVLGLETLGILQLLDGTTSLTDIQALVMRESKDLRVGHVVREFIGKLDELLLLQSPRFEAALAQVQAEWHRLEVRPAALEGLSYPAERELLERFVDAHFAAAEKQRIDAGGSPPAASALPRALLAPHLDPGREGPVMARAYLEIGEAAAAEETPLRVVIWGTGHQLADEFAALTRKRFETPLGQVPCDTSFVDYVAAKLGEHAYRREIVHRDEHSIEFQVPYLQRRLRGRPFTIVPILCGSFHRLLDDRRRPGEEPVIETLVTAVREAESKFGGPTLHVAGVDFSHVGPRFGDSPLDAEDLQALGRADELAIEAAASGDAEAWFTAIVEADDATRICGFAPTYFMLRAASPGAGRRLEYAQSGEPDSSVVTVAAMAWP